MRTVPATEFKARCLELMERVAQRRETFVITKRGKPVAKLVPVERKPKEPLFGRLRDLVDEVGDIMHPAVPPEVWETVGDESEKEGKLPGQVKSRRGLRRPACDPEWPKP